MHSSLLSLFANVPLFGASEFGSRDDQIVLGHFAIVRTSFIISGTLREAQTFVRQFAVASSAV
jgi:hypothetical protein